MNILHILGNGFDINLGLKTGYGNFYNYYKEIGSEDSVIMEVKENIGSNSNDWSDLEIALGNYTSKLSKENFIKVYEDLVNNLCDYLEKEEELFKGGGFSYDKMFSYLAFTHDYLEYKDKLEIEEFVTQLNEEVKINVVSLNYTKTLENILINHDHYRRYNVTRERISYVLGEIKHIHGYVNNRVVLGVNDSEQILNTKYNMDPEIKGMFIKHDSNLNQKHSIDDECYSLIEKTDVFYIFGSSLGLTDRYIWKLVGKRVEEGAKVVIFVRGNDINFRLGHQVTNARKKTVKKFMELSCISGVFEKNIYVGIKTDMFNFK